MTIVSNTSPLCYLALIGHAEILPKLYGNVHITQKVLDELRQNRRTAVSSRLGNDSARLVKNSFRPGRA